MWVTRSSDCSAVGDEPPERSCLAAIRAGLGMLAKVAALNAELSREFGISLEIGIGARYGPLVVGMMGHPSHLQFTVVGDAINMASRIEGANKALGTRFLVSEVLFNQVPQAPVAVRKTQAVLKGKQGTFQLVEAIGFAAPDAALLVQSTLGVLLQHQARFTEGLYQRLFESAPGAKALFSCNMETQGRMLSHMLPFLVYAMSRPETMALGLQDLGRRHDGYGVVAEYYPAFRQAFLESARAVLGDEFSAPVERAWADIIDMIINSMLGKSTGIEGIPDRGRVG